jgi:HK97 family phage major capsid protein
VTSETITAEKAKQANGSAIVRAKVNANVPKGQSFVRYAQALTAGKGSVDASIRFCKSAMQRGGWDNTPEVLDWLELDISSIMREKAAVGVGTTTDATWASPLIAYNVLASEFIEFLRPNTIIGRIPGLRRVPFNIQMPRTTSATSAGWVGENAPKPVSAMAFDTVQLRWAKAAGIVVLTDELVRFSNPSAEAVVRQDLVDTITQFLDRQFVDPSVAAVTNVSPASITNGVTGVTPTGTNEAALRADVATLFANLLTLNLSPSGGVWIMTQQQALRLSLMVNSLGQSSFPNINAEGGTLFGYPVVASENIPSTTGSPTEGYPIIFALAKEILLADDGQVVLDASNQASIQLDSAPDSPPGASTAYISMWQMNMTGLRAERWINWLKRRTGVVQFISAGLYR